MPHRIARNARVRRSASALAIAAALSLGAAPPASAQAAQRKEIHLPAQDLGASLDALAAQTGVRLLYSPDAVNGRRAPAVDGRFEAREALERLLAGSGLEIRADGDGTFAVRPAPARHAPEGREEHQLGELTITATRTQRRVDEVPASVSVITAKDIVGRNVDKLQDMLKTAESVEVNQASLSVAHSKDVEIRGTGGSRSASTSKILVDGISTDSFVSNVMGHGGLNFFSPWDVEQVEVVRGPASALYGPEVVGGVVNLIPKRWSGAPGAEVHASYGSRDTKKIGVAAGVAGEAGDVRISYYDAQSDGFVAQTEPDRATGATSVDVAPRQWKDSKAAIYGRLYPSDRQELTFSYQKFATRSFLQGGHPFMNLDMDGAAMTAGYKHAFDRVTVSATYRKTDLAQWYAVDREYWFGAPGDLGFAKKGAKYSNSDDFSLQADWRITPDNLLIAGYNYNSGQFRLENLSGSVDISKSRVDGFYLQDEIRFGAWNVLFGGRQDHIKEFDDTTNGVKKNPDTSVTVFNPRVGARYHWTPATSFYASAGQAYVPALNQLKFKGSASWADNPDLKAEESTSYELGVQSRLPWGDIRAAIFHTDYKNKINSVKVNATQYQEQNIDKVEVDGVEIGWKGRIGFAWSLFSNYAYTDSRVKADSRYPVNNGTHMPLTSIHKINAGATYSPGGPWSASLFATYRTDKYLARSFVCPSNNAERYNCHLGGYLTADAKLTTRLPIGGQDRWSAWLAVNNITDKRYQEYQWFERSEGRTVAVGIDGKF